MRFNDKLKKTIQDLNISQAQLVGMTGIGKSSISQYLSGKNIPTEERQKHIAVSLGLAPDYFEQDEELLLKKILKSDSAVIPQISVESVAKLMRKDKKTIRDGLRQGVFEWGYGIKTSNHWTFFINATAFAQKEKIEVPKELIF